MQQSPNLTPNVANATVSPITIWCFAILGIVIQLSVISVAALVTYHRRVPARGSTTVSYGFYLLVIGNHKCERQ
ncbi:hypothetical protein BDW59DRAFT_50248 [Aspergillus cavernicola]|uniref:Uncharacterized protein n=1 Tax=Aspergillus cavernicola TaxID=176166 RepID=A0ABR4IMR9_9EURO